MKDAPPAGVVLSPIYRKKLSEAPQYDDFMNVMFANKTHKSFHLRHQADLRTKYLEGKAFQGQQEKIREDEKRIQAELEKKKEKDENNENARSSTRRNMAH